MVALYMYVRVRVDPVVALAICISNPYFQLFNM